MSPAILEAKRRLPLPSLMEKLGLRRHAKKNAFCPFHENTRTPAFSIFRDRDGLWRWKCHAQCGAGDEITFLERHAGLSPREAARQFLDLAGVRRSDGSSFLQIPQAPTSAAPPEPAAHRVRPSFPLFGDAQPGDLAQLAALRRLSFAALHHATSDGVLHFATLRGQRAWIITDPRRVNAQARRLDGQPWEHIAAKAWTLPGSWAAHPIGLDEAAHYPRILLVEGGPDLLAAWHFIDRAGREDDCHPVAMLGAAQRLPDYALPCFAGKHVRILPHVDAAGQKAAREWAETLLEAGAACVDAFALDGLRQADGQPVEDLNDATSLAPEQAPLLEGILP